MSGKSHTSRPSLMNITQADALKIGAGLVPALYLGSATHVAPFLSKEGGISQRIFLPFWYKVFSLLRLGTPSKGKLPIALLVAGASVTFIFSAAGSIYANASSSDNQGYSNREPRVKKKTLTGLQGRVASTHDNLLEFFGGFAAAAILAAQYDSKGTLNNQLALVAFLKYVIFPVAYYADLDVLRTFSHLISVGGVVNTIAKIAFA